MPSFLVEFFSEEIPARMQAHAASYLRESFEAALKEAGLKHDAPKTFVTPRRVALACDGIPSVQPDVTTEKKGPKVGAPQAAIDGFVKSSGIALEKLEKRMVGKDEAYFATLHSKGQPAAAVLKVTVEKIMNDFPWPKSMRWGSGEKSWVRPLHSILCLFDGHVVPVEYAGVKAGNVTYGHRFLAPDAIAMKEPGEYAAKLKAAKVLAEPEERKADILKHAEALAAKEGLTLKRDDGLLAEVTGLVEWPTLLIGRIDGKYMDLPAEVLVSEMRAHQKYFALLRPSSRGAAFAPSDLKEAKEVSTGSQAGDPALPLRGPQDDAEMSDRFLITANMVTSDGGKAVIAGNERVLRARLSDGRFFWDQDRKKPLAEWAKGLEGVTFHAKIGTVAEKVARITALAVKLSEYVFSPHREEVKKGAAVATTVQQSPHPNPQGEEIFKQQVARAASLCKADLTTGMVGEFPELQGVMGRYYALNQKEEVAVADAIRDHYLPLGPDSPVPTKPVSVCVALADKLDTLVCMFAVGEKPTGSKDPFALRRSALGIIRIILENNLRLPLKAFLNDELLAFFSDRLKVQLKDSGIRHDLIAAVVADGDDDLVRVVARAKALQEFLGSEDGKNLLVAYKRATSIVSIEEKKDKQTYKYKGAVDSGLLKEPEEKPLYAALENAGPQAMRAFRNQDYVGAMKALAVLRGPVDTFFDRILVNVKDDEALRANRLNLLARIRATLDGIANFALIEG
jgi:glycyl-tRNA synthetase beta chain